MRRAGLIPAALFLAAFFLWPLWQILAAATGEAWDWLAQPYASGHLRVAVLQAVLSVLATLLIAVPLAWHHHQRNIPLRRFHLALHAAPFVLPVFVVVGAMRGLLGPFGWLSHLAGRDLLATMGPLAAVILAHAYYNYGFAARILQTALRRRPVRLEAAAATLGAGPRQAFWRASMPVLWPQFAAVALLVFVFAFSSFGVVLLLGGGLVHTPETLLYANLLGVRVRADRAAVLAVLQLVINGAMLWAYLRMQRHGVQRETAPARFPARHRDNAVAWLGLVLAMLPLLVVLAGGFRLDGQWSLEPWRSLVDHGHPDHRAGFDLLRALDRSMWYAGWSTAAGLGMTASVAYGRRRGLEWLASLPLGASSVVIGLGLLLAYGAGDPVDLRGGQAIILVAHTLVVFPFMARILLPAFDSLDKRLDEAAALLGASAVAIAWRVHLPILRGSIAVAVGFAVAISLGDFGASLLVMRSDTASLAVWIGRHDEPFRAIAHSQMLALSGLLMLLAGAAYVVMERFRGQEEW